MKKCIKKLKKSVTKIKKIKKMKKKRKKMKKSVYYEFILWIFKKMQNIKMQIQNIKIVFVKNINIKK